MLVCLLWPVALCLLLLSAYAWWRTLGMTRSMIHAGSLDLAQGSTDSLVDKLLRLDLSTMSALGLSADRLVPLLRCRLAGAQARAAGILAGVRVPGLCGLLATVMARARQHTPGPDRYAVELRHNLDDAVSRPESSASEGPGSGREAASALTAAGSTSETAGPLPAPSGDSDAFVVGSSRTSFQVFLLLCASLYSSLVGCGAGYFLIPAINRIGVLAAGRARERFSDPDLARHEYTAQIERAVGELALLAERSAAVRTMTDDLAGLRTGPEHGGAAAERCNRPDGTNRAKRRRLGRYDKGHGRGRRASPGCG